MFDSALEPSLILPLTFSSVVWGWNRCRATLQNSSQSEDLKNCAATDFGLMQHVHVFAFTYVCYVWTPVWIWYECVDKRQSVKCLDSRRCWPEVIFITIAQHCIVIVLVSIFMFHPINDMTNWQPNRYNRLADQLRKISEAECDGNLLMFWCLFHGRMSSSLADSRVHVNSLQKWFDFRLLNYDLRFIHCKYTGHDRVMESDMLMSTQHVYTCVLYISTCNFNYTHTESHVHTSIHILQTKTKNPVGFPGQPDRCPELKKGLLTAIQNSSGFRCKKSLQGWQHALIFYYLEDLLLLVKSEILLYDWTMYIYIYIS